MSRLARALPPLLALLALAPRPAAAESPLLGSAEFTVGGYRPDIDGALTPPAGAPFPYQATFGSGRPLVYKLHVARALPWRQYGTLELGGGAGYWVVKGHAVDEAGAATADPTALKMIPAQLTATWRADFLWDRWRVPFVPYARLGLQHYSWWITGASGGTVKSGATNGWSYGGGVGLVLDLLDPMLAREFDADIGVNHTILVFDVTRAKVDDFGKAASFRLTDAQPTYSVGLLFVF